MENIEVLNSLVHFFGYVGFYAVSVTVVFMLFVAVLCAMDAYEDFD